MASADIQGEKAPGRLNFIEGLRGLAALYVVFQHICSMIDPLRRLEKPGAQPEWLSIVTHGMWFGGLAVAAFIVISGYCLQLSLYNRGDGRIQGLSQFLKRRCWRILPPYYACLVLSLVVCWLVTRNQSGLPWSQYLPVTWENTAAHFAMIHNLRPEWMYKINGVLWSISIEFQLYFLFPVLVAILWKLGRIALPVILGIIAAIILITYPQSAKLFVHFLPLFGLGMCAASVAFKKESKKVPTTLLWSISLLALIATIVACETTKEFWIRDSLCGISLAAFLAASGISPISPISKLLGAKPLVFLGSFSYSLYLMHHPILQVLFVNRPAWASTVTRQFAFLVACIPVILGLAWCFYWVFERPFVKARTKTV